MHKWKNIMDSLVIVSGVQGWVVKDIADIIIKKGDIAMDKPKVYLNKNNFIEKIELPDGRESMRIYGNLPDLLLLVGYEEKEFDMYDHNGNKIKECLLLNVTKNKVRYDVLNVVNQE